MPTGISLHKNSSKRKKKHPKRRKSSKKKGFITEPVHEENPRDKANDSSQQESQIQESEITSARPASSIVESDSSDSDSGEGPAFTSVERHAVRKRLPKRIPKRGKKKSKSKKEKVQQLKERFQKAIRKQEVSKRDKEATTEFFDTIEAELEKLKDIPDSQILADLERSSHTIQRPHDENGNSDDQAATGSPEIENAERRRTRSGSLEDTSDLTTASRTHQADDESDRGNNDSIASRSISEEGDTPALDPNQDVDERTPLLGPLRNRRDNNVIDDDINDDLRRKFNLTGSDIEAYKQKLESFRENGVNWKTALDLFKSDPDFEEIFEDRMKRPVDSPEEGEGRLKRLGAMVKKELKGRNLGLSAVGIIPFVNIIKSLSDRESEKDRKRVTKGILNFSNDETAKKLAKPLYAGHRKLQAEQAATTGINTVTSSLLPLSAVVPTSLSVLVKQPGAKIGVKAGTALMKTLTALGIKKGGAIAITDEDHDPKGNERTKVLLEFLGMKSRMNLLEENPDLVTKLGKEQVMNELLRLQIRKSLGMTDDNQDLLDREPDSKQRKHIGRIPKLGKKLEKDEYLKDADLDAYRQLKKLKNSKPRSEQSDDDTDNSNQEPDLSEVNRLALMFKAEGLFKDGPNRLRKTKGFRRILEEKSRIETAKNKYETKKQRLKKERDDNTEDIIKKELIGRDPEKTRKRRIAVRELENLRGNPKRLLDAELEKYPKTRIKKAEKNIKSYENKIQEIRGGSKRFWRRSNKSSPLSEDSRMKIGILNDQIEESRNEIRNIKQKVKEEKEKHSYPSSKGNNFTRMFKT